MPLGSLARFCSSPDPETNWRQLWSTSLLTWTVRGYGIISRSQSRLWDCSRLKPNRISLLQSTENNSKPHCSWPVGKNPAFRRASVAPILTQGSSLLLSCWVQRLGRTGGRTSISVWCRILPGTRLEIKAETLPTGHNGSLPVMRKKDYLFSSMVEYYLLTSGGLISVRQHIKLALFARSVSRDFFNTGTIRFADIPYCISLSIIPKISNCDLLIPCPL